MQSYATKVGSKAGDVFKLLKEKGTIIHERIEESPCRTDKLEEIFSNLGTAFASAKTPVKISKSTQVTKNKGATSSNDKGDLKMISIHPNLSLYNSRGSPFDPFTCAWEVGPTRHGRT